MSVQRSPPSSQQSQLRPPNTSTAALHYNSDSALNKSSIMATDEIYFNVTKRQKRNLADHLDEPSISVSAVQSLISDLRDQQDLKFEAINKALMTIVTQNQDIQKSITLLSNQYEDLQIELNQLKLENSDYKSKISQLEAKLDLTERKSCSSMIEIRNLPSVDTVNKKELITMVQSICATIDPNPILESEIRDIFKKKSDVVVVDFTSILRKESLINHYKRYNKDRRGINEPILQSEQINSQRPARPIYISEYLTSKTRRLFYLAREKVKNKSLAACWTSFGKVFVKKEENATPMRVNAESELLSL